MKGLPRIVPLHDHASVMLSLEPTSSTPASSSRPTPSSRSTPGCSPSPPVLLLPRLVLRLRRVVNQQRIQRQRVRQDVIPDRAPTDVDRVQTYRLARRARVTAVLRRHLDRPQRRVHLRRHRRDGAMDYGAVLEFNGDRLVGAFHEESTNLVSCCSGLLRMGTLRLRREFRDWSLHRAEGGALT